MLEIHRLDLRKADESLAGAESEYANGRYNPELRGALARTFNLRQTADYRDISLTATEAGRALRRARQFVEAVHAREGTAL